MIEFVLMIRITEYIRRFRDVPIIINERRIVEFILQMYEKFEIMSDVAAYYFSVWQIHVRAVNSYKL